MIILKINVNGLLIFHYHRNLYHFWKPLSEVCGVFFPPKKTSYFVLGPSRLTVLLVSGEQHRDCHTHTWVFLPQTPFPSRLPMTLSRVPCAVQWILINYLFYTVAVNISWEAAVHGVAESDTTETLHFHISLSCIGEVNDNPLQCSCLENPRDGGAWWAASYGVAQSWIRLKWLSITYAGWKKSLVDGDGFKLQRFSLPWRLVVGLGTKSSNFLITGLLPWTTSSRARVLSKSPH